MKQKELTKKFKMISNLKKNLHGSNNNILAL